MKLVRKMFKNEEGATAIEYGLIAALIAVAAIVAMGQLGNQLGSTFNEVSTTMETGEPVT
ncbi:MAG: Flp family type IVb pilin [Parasphingorhabdus sp.]